MKKTSVSSQENSPVLKAQVIRFHYDRKEQGDVLSPEELAKLRFFFPRGKGELEASKRDPYEQTHRGPLAQSHLLNAQYFCPLMWLSTYAARWHLLHFIFVASCINQVPHRSGPSRGLPFCPCFHTQPTCLLVKAVQLDLPHRRKQILNGPSNLTHCNAPTRQTLNTRVLASKSPGYPGVQCWCLIYKPNFS